MFLDVLKTVREMVHETKLSDAAVVVVLFVMFCFSKTKVHFYEMTPSTYDERMDKIAFTLPLMNFKRNSDDSNCMYNYWHR